MSTIHIIQWRHNERDGVSNHQPHDYFLKRLFRRRSKKALKLRVTGLCEGNSPVTGEFSAQRASNKENVSIWWRHHEESPHTNSRPKPNHNCVCWLSSIHHAGPVAGTTINKSWPCIFPMFSCPLMISNSVLGMSCHLCRRELKQGLH